MKKIITTLFIALISISLFAKSGKIFFSGQVQNHSIKTIKISHLNNQKVVEADLDSNGNFTTSTKIEDGYYFLEYGRNTAYIYLYPKDKLKLVFDANHFPNTLVFEGKGAERNNYLVKKQMVSSELTKDLSAFYKVNETKYLQNIEDYKKNLTSLLNKYDVEDFFKREEIKSLEYERLLSIQNYKSNYKFYIGDDISPSDNFYNTIQSIKLDNHTDYKKQPYYRYLVNSIWSKRIESTNDVDGMLDVLRKVPSKEIFINLANGFFSKISSSKERSKDYLDLIKKITKHKPYIEAAEKQYKETLTSNKLTKGSISPLFSYEDINGKIIKLSDLKGKYVYIDVWATWCAPCIKQVPYLQQLEEKYHEKNIVFVSISVDKLKAKATWRRMVIDRRLGGIQLFADKSFDSDFMNAYAVNSIPRFILIDPEGKIINPEAPRPSFNKTTQILDNLLN